jgi:Putative Ig domain
MHFFHSARATRPGRKIVRALTAGALLSSTWLVATAAPVLSGAPAPTVTAAHYYAFQPGASDGGRTLTFSIANKPSWAQFDTRTGRLYGTPLPQSNVGTFANISISASDGSSRGNLAPFAITVLPLPNTPPRISGAPATSVAVGQTYSFRPAASDPNGLRLAFGIANKPAWAAFDGATGLLSGTPAAANAGTYPNITITAYDGWTKAVLPPFSLAVRPAGTPSPPPVTPPPVTPPPVTSATATLSWSPPTQHTNGTVLTDLAGYHIYYGTTPSLGQSLTVANPGLTRYVMTGLTRATWYFEMTAYDRAGIESAPTAVQSIVTQ